MTVPDRPRLSPKIMGTVPVPLVGGQSHWTVTVPAPSPGTVTR